MRGLPVMLWARLAAPGSPGSDPQAVRFSESNAVLKGASRGIVPDSLGKTDFPFHKLTNPRSQATRYARQRLPGTSLGLRFPDGDTPDHPLTPAQFTACDAANVISDTDDVASSMGVHFGKFGDIPLGTGAGLTGASFGPVSHGVKALVRDQRSSVLLDNIDRLPGSPERLETETISVE